MLCYAFNEFISWAPLILVIGASFSKFWVTLKVWEELLFSNRVSRVMSFLTCLANNFCGTTWYKRTDLSKSSSSVRALTRLGSSLEKASLVGANTVKGPSPFKASTRSTCLRRLMSVVASSSWNEIILKYLKTEALVDLKQKIFISYQILMKLWRKCAICNLSKFYQDWIRSEGFFNERQLLFDSTFLCPSPCVLKYMDRAVSALFGIF